MVATDSCYFIYKKMEVIRRITVIICSIVINFYFFHIFK